jgi:hypothetical protein
MERRPLGEERCLVGRPTAAFESTRRARARAWDFKLVVTRDRGLDAVMWAEDMQRDFVSRLTFVMTSGV